MVGERRMVHKASANLLWLGAAVTLSAFVAAYVVAAFVADRLVDCTTPAVLPVAYFIMLGYAVMAAQIGIMDMVSAGRPPPYVEELQWASFVVIGLAVVWSPSSTASGWSSASSSCSSCRWARSTSSSA